MLTWMHEYNGHENLYKAYFGKSCEITIVEFQTGGYVAWVKKLPNVSTLLKKSYAHTYSLEEVKDDFVESLREHLCEKAIYWSELYDSLESNF